MADSHLTTMDAFEILARRGYRTTQPRHDVVESVLQQSRPFSVEQIVHMLPAISRSTVYRTVEIMASVGILSRLMHPNGHPAYVVGEPGHRHHLICSSCGFVVPVTTCPVDAMVEKLGQRHDFSIEGHSLEIFGRCQDCR